MQTINYKQYIYIKKMKLKPLTPAEKAMQQAADLFEPTAFSYSKMGWEDEFEIWNKEDANENKKLVLTYPS